MKFVYYFKSFTNGNGNSMVPIAKIYARSGPGPRDNLSGFSRGDNDALSHRDKAVINNLYNCAGKNGQSDFPF